MWTSGRFAGTHLVLELCEGCTESHADELVHGPHKERDNELSEPCPSAGAENVPVTEIEDTKRQDLTK
jgi:hypothetical protein